MRLTTDRLDDTKRALKVQKQKGVRLRKKVDHLQTVIESLQDGNLISANCSEMLQATFSGVPSELMQRMLRARFLHLITCHVPGPEIEPVTSGMLSGRANGARANHYTYDKDYE